MLRERRYSDEQLGLNKLIDEEVMPFDARFRSFSDWKVPYDERWRYFEEEAVGHERERMHFEHNLTLVFWQADERNPPDRQQRDEAYRSAMDECAAASGFKEVILYEDPDIDPERFLNDGAALLAEGQALLDSYESQFGLSREAYLDLRHECAKQAASYPSLSPAIRDSLVEQLKDHYRQAVYEYLQEFPDAEVLLVDHPGAPRPLEDRLIKACQESSDPAACANEFRVVLPAE